VKRTYRPTYRRAVRHADGARGHEDLAPTIDGDAADWFPTCGNCKRPLATKRPLCKDCEAKVTKIELLSWDEATDKHRFRVTGAAGWCDVAVYLRDDNPDRILANFGGSCWPGDLPDVFEAPKLAYASAMPRFRQGVALPGCCRSCGRGELGTESGDLCTRCEKDHADAD